MLHRESGFAKRWLMLCAALHAVPQRAECGVEIGAACGKRESGASAILRATRNNQKAIDGKNGPAGSWYGPAVISIAGQRLR
jgi:hypothetical protein